MSAGLFRNLTIEDKGTAGCEVHVVPLSENMSADEIAEIASALTGLSITVSTPKSSTERPKTTELTPSTPEPSKELNETTSQKVESKSSSEKITKEDIELVNKALKERGIGASAAKKNKFRKELRDFLEPKEKPKAYKIIDRYSKKELGANADDLFHPLPERGEDGRLQGHRSPGGTKYFFKNITPEFDKDGNISKISIRYERRLFAPNGRLQRRLGDCDVQLLADNKNEAFKELLRIANDFLKSDESTSTKTSKDPSRHDFTGKKEGRVDDDMPQKKAAPEPTPNKSMFSKEAEALPPHTFVEPADDDDIYS